MNQEAQAAPVPAPEIAPVTSVTEPGGAVPAALEAPIIKGSKRDKAAKKAAKAKAPKKAKPAKATKTAGKSGSNKGVSGPAVLKMYAPQYKKGGKDGKTKTAGGNLAIDCADRLADRWRGKDLAFIYEDSVKVINSQLEEGEKPVSIQSLKLKYNKLNPGMQRMNLGNRVRAILFPRAGK